MESIIKKSLAKFPENFSAFLARGAHRLSFGYAMRTNELSRFSVVLWYQSQHCKCHTSIKAITYLKPFWFLGGSPNASSGTFLPTWKRVISLWCQLENKKTVGYLSLQSSRTWERAILCLQFHRLRPLVLLIRVTLRYERTWRCFWIILTEDNWSTAQRVVSSFRRKVVENCALLICYTAILDPWRWNRYVAPKRH